MVAQKSFKGFVRQPGVAEKRKELRDKGIQEKDIDFAFALCFWIEFFDGKNFFPDTVQANFCDWPSSDGTVAAYWPHGKCYVIYVPGIYERMREEWQRQFVHMTKNGNVSYPLSRLNKKKLISWREALIGLAAHEVRHRMQETPGFRIFTDTNPPMEKTGWDLYSKLAGKRRLTKKDMLALELSGQRDSREKSGRKMDLPELDALTVEGTAISLSRIGSSANKIAAIIKMQPAPAAGSS